MTGDNRTRHCDLCGLNVYNFSEMATEEIQKLVSKSEGRICGRLYRRRDGTILTKDCPVGFRAYQKRITRFAGAALATILGLFSVSFGQKTEEKSADNSKLNIVRTISQEPVLSGTIVDAAGAAIPDAPIFLYRDQMIVRSLASDKNGKFSISLINGTYKLGVQKDGFQAFQSAEILINDKEQVNLGIRLDEGQFVIGVTSTVELVEIDLEPKIQTETMPRKPE